MPLWGRQIDRHGSRKMVVIIAFLFGLACIYMGFVQNILMLGVGFFAIRMLSQGSLGLVSQTVLCAASALSLLLSLLSLTVQKPLKQPVQIEPA